MSPTWLGYYLLRLIVPRKHPLYVNYITHANWCRWRTRSTKYIDYGSQALAIIVLEVLRRTVLK